MATIATTFVLRDNMTKSITRINNALGQTIKGADALGVSMDGTFKITKIQAAHNQLEKTGATFAALKTRAGEVASNIRRAGDNQERFKDKLGDSVGPANRIARAIGSIAGAYLSFQALVTGGRAFVGLADELAGIDARMGMIVQEGQTLAELQKEIYASSMRSRASYQDTANLVTQLGINAKDAFGNNTELIAFAETVNKQFALSGANAEAMRGATVQLTQALASGTLRGDELNSILEQAPMLAQSISDYMGIARGDIRTVAQEGMITSDIVKNAVLADMADVNAAFDEMPMTFGQTVTAVKNEAVRSFSGAADAWIDFVNSDAFQAGVSVVIQGIRLAGMVTEKVVGAMTAGAEWVHRNWSRLEPLFVGLTVLLGGLLLGKVFSLGIGFAVMGAKALSAGGAILSFAAAHPVLLAVAGATAVAVMVARHYGVTWQDVAGIFGGTVSAIQAGLYNLDAAVYNSQEKIRVGFHNAWEYVKEKFMEMINWVARKMDKMAPALAFKNPELALLNQGIQAMAGRSYTAQYREGSYLSYRDVGAAFSGGKERARAGFESFTQGVSGLFNADGTLATNIGSAIDTPKLDKNLKAIKDDTGAIRDNTTAWTDSLEYLRYLAEGRTMNHIEQNIKLDLATEINNPGADFDMDGYTSQLGEALREEVENVMREVPG